MNEIASSYYFSGTSMDKKLEQIGLNDIRHMNDQECEETLLYLRYYISRMHPGTRQAGFQVLVQQLQARLQSPPGPGEQVAGGPQATA